MALSALEQHDQGCPSITTARLSVVLREATRDLHRQAERTGIVRALLRGSASRRGHALYLRNLLPAYQALEQGLARHGGRAALAMMARPALHRSAALSADLEQLAGPTWRDDLVLLPAGRHYRDHVAGLADGDPAGLLGHAYVRYMGDLSGGQILARLLSRTLGLQPAELRFYAFPDLADLDDVKAEIRAALDRLSPEAIDFTAVVNEAARAFTFNIAVSAAVDRAMSGGAAAARGHRPRPSHS